MTVTFQYIIIFKGKVAIIYSIKSGQLPTKCFGFGKYWLKLNCKDIFHNNNEWGVVHENLAIYSHNPEVRYIEFLLMDSGSELSPEQDPVVWKILNFGHLALNSANWTLNSVFP